MEKVEKNNTASDQAREDLKKSDKFQDYVKGTPGKTTDEKAQLDYDNATFGNCINIHVQLDSVFKLMSYRTISVEQYKKRVYQIVEEFNTQQAVLLRDFVKKTKD